MKNQLIWTFQHHNTTSSNVQTNEGISYTSVPDQQPHHHSFVPVAPQNFGINNLSAGEAMIQIYRLAFERTQAQLQKREAELQRFSQLLEDVNWSDAEGEGYDESPHE